MRGKMGRIKIMIFLILSLAFTQACFAEGGYFREKRNSVEAFTIEGHVTNTWSWGESYPTCDTQDEMSLAIAEDRSVVLRAHGACYFLSCTPTESTLSCGMVLYGTYDYQKDQVTIYACNNINSKNASGTIELGTMEERHYISSINVSCDLNSEQHTLTTFSP